ncbi:MAG: ATP-binding protein [Clostridia bacterium]|nr:ATP-binding protein [Clostridia bacterium]
MAARKLPIGIQGFEGLRKDGYVYVDKTEYVYHLVHEGKPYFLSRPRRFGKSLLLSTMKAYWEGKKELFAGLAIEKLEESNPQAWASYPVFYFDFNGANYQKKTALEDIIDEQLRRWEKDYHMIASEKVSLGERFRNLIIEASNKTGLRCVVLVDEYDKPLLDVIDHPELQDHNKEVFKGFFSTLKSFDEYIQFIFITGVSKFHKVSIFSDLNQLRDISMAEEYAALCGITEKEIDQYFPDEIAAFAKRRKMTVQDCRDALKTQYDGYHFHPEGEAVYNPYSLLTALMDKDFGSYWFETGTPTFLIQRLRKNLFDVRKLTDQTIYSSESTLKDYTGDSLDPIPLLYQTGYLTITDYDAKRRRYTLSFPNEEVRYGFLESLMPAYVPKATAGNGLDIFTLDEAVESGNLEQIRNVLTGLFAGITYTLETDPFEHYFQAVIYLVFTLLGKFCQCEMHTYTGRIDCRVQTRDYIYLFEFKRDDTAQAALAQIDSKDYALPFIADSRKLYKIGVSFDSESRTLKDWAAAE